MYLRNLDSQLKLLIKKNQSAFILEPRQTGKTTLAKKCFRLKSNVTDLPLQNPEIRLEMEIDLARLIKQLKVRTKKGYVFIDEAQKVPAIFDSVQYAIDEELASFIKSYKEQIKQAYVVTNGRVPEKLSDMITAIPWRYL